VRFVISEGVSNLIVKLNLEGSLDVPDNKTKYRRACKHIESAFAGVRDKSSDQPTWHIADEGKEDLFENARRVCRELNTLLDGVGKAYAYIGADRVSGEIEATS
jgi:hypothetical protein